MQLCWARLVREPSTYRILRMAVMGSLAIALVWFRGGLGLGRTAHRPGRHGGQRRTDLAGAHHRHAPPCDREAMGFGDVTLMAMIGAFLGWQPCLVIFFLAPFAGLVVGVLRLILFRDKEIPYGPFLCLAALALIVNWNALWTWSQPLFALGRLVPLVMLGCLVLMALMLAGWRLILSLFR